MADNTTNSLTNNEVVKQGNNEYRRTVQHLPAFYRTDTNQRFFSSTLDPLVQKGNLERLDGYVGRQDAYTRTANDRYLSTVHNMLMQHEKLRIVQTWVMRPRREEEVGTRGSHAGIDPSVSVLL